jgi:hypothetical protein
MECHGIRLGDLKRIGFFVFHKHSTPGLVQTPNAANGFRQQTEQKRSKQFFRGGTVRVGVLYLLHELKVPIWNQIILPR